MTQHSLNNLPQRKTGRLHGNVIGEDLLPLAIIFCYIPPLMHIIMGLGNDVINELKRLVIEMDSEESESDVQVNQMKGIEKWLKELYEKKESLETQHANNALDRYIAENDLERKFFIKEKQIRKAAEIAKKNGAQK